MENTTLNVYAPCQTFLTVKRKKATEHHFLWAERFLASSPPVSPLNHPVYSPSYYKGSSEAKCLRKAAFKDAIWY